MSETAGEDTRPSTAPAGPTPLAPLDTGRLNQPVQPAGRSRRAPVAERTGIRAGTFILRPSLTQVIASETDQSDGTSDTRVYSETEVRLDVMSDWSRHALSISGGGSFQENLSGDGATDPSAGIDAELRLDLANVTEARLRAGYDFYREDENDPNAVNGARLQPDVHVFSAGAGLRRARGLIGASLEVDAERTVYGIGEAADGSAIAFDDRDRNDIGVTARVFLNNGAILRPYAEGDVSRTAYDETRDSSGFERSAWTYGLRAGLEVDGGEKWSGDIAAGYVLRDLDDSRLNDIDAVTVDATLEWSPRRGTEISLRAGSQLEGSTAPGVSGSVAYEGYIALAQTVRDGITARLGGGVLQRDYRDNGLADETIFTADAGLTWAINPYLDALIEAAYENTRPDGGTSYDTTTIGIGLTLRR